MTDLAREPRHLRVLPEGSCRPAPLRISMFGGFDVEGRHGEVGDELRPRYRRLLAYLLLRRRGVAREALQELLWPDLPADTGGQRLRNLLFAVQRVLRTAIGQPSATLWTRPRSGACGIDPAYFEVDVWRFEAALARHTPSGDDEVRALSEAVALYRGDLLDGTYYEWVEPMRAGLRNRALDAAVRLSELLVADGRLGEAVRVLETGTETDPYAEDLHRRLIAVHLTMGRHGAARHAFAHLEVRLAELGCEPAPETVALLLPTSA
jgi:DNA-binding SARP family transcriptional activator